MEKRTIFWIVSLVIALSVASYFTFGFFYKCNDISCFKKHQAKCAKTEYYFDGNESTWLYKIHGVEEGKCSIVVKLIQVKKGRLDKEGLEGKEMDCFLDIGSLAAPESDLSKCHGRLKEDLQEIIIRNTHAEIVSNLETEIKKAFS